MLIDYFQVAVQAICLSNMFHVLAEVSPYVIVSVMLSVDSAPNSVYTVHITIRIAAIIICCAYYGIQCWYHILQGGSHLSGLEEEQN